MTSFIETHFSRLCLGLHGSDRVCPRFQWQLAVVRLDRHPRASESGPLQVIPFSGGWVYCLTAEVPLFRGMQTRPEAFLELLDPCELRLCSRTHIQTALCHTCTLGGAYDKYQLARLLALIRAQSNKGRLEAVKSPASGRRAVSLTPLSPCIALDLTVQFKL